MKVIVAEPVKIYQIVLRMRLKNSPILIVSTPEEAKTAMAEAPKGSVLVTALFFPGHCATGWDLAETAQKLNLRSFCCTDRWLLGNEREPFDETFAKLELPNVCEREVNILKSLSHNSQAHNV
jgi:hypothetical protein